MKKGQPSSTTSLPKARGAGAKTKRVARAQRALKRSYFLRKRSADSQSFDFTLEQRQALLKMLRRLSPTPSPQQETVVLAVTQAAVDDLIASRVLASDGTAEMALLATVIDSAERFSGAWANVASNEAIRHFFNFLYSNRDNIDFSVARKRVKKKIIDIIPRYDVPITMITSDLCITMSSMLNILRDSNRIVRLFEYTFVTTLGLLWISLGSEPTLTRNTEASDKAPKTLFQSFIECAAPKPAIGDEILRGALDHLKTIWG
jgi:hypothetical protein